MKIVIGADGAGLYENVLNLAERLMFAESSFLFAHSVSTIIPIGAYGIVSEAPYAANLIRLAKEAGRRTLDQAKELAVAHGIDARTVLLDGDAARSLLELADREEADLVCVHSQRKGSLGSLFLGSVSRGLAIASKQSVLISKGSVPPEGRLTAVFATDLSEFAGKALDKFIEMRPLGIEKVHVVHALHIGELGAHFDEADDEMPIEGKLIATARAQVEAVVSQLQDAGFTSSGEVLNLTANEAITEAMASSRSDLLVMGAQGHGFIHRAMVGSTCLHQVVAGPHALFIVRP